MQTLSTLVVEISWQLFNDALARLSQHLILSLTRRARGTWLKRKCCPKDGVGGVDRRCDISVVMEAEHLSLVNERNLLPDELDVVLTFTVIGHIVGATRAQCMVLLIDHVHVVVVVEHCLDTTPILWIGDTTTVVCLGCHISQGLEWDLVVEIEELDELLEADAKIRCRELVGLIPTERAELLPLQDHGVEEAETPE